MRASVVIPTYNRLQDLQRVVSAVRSQAPSTGTGLETVVVDDGSSDGTWEWLSSQAGSPDLKVLRQSNSGPARARNHGVSAASGDLVLFLGDDTEPQPGWLAHHLEEHRLFGGTSVLAVIGYTSFADDRTSPFLRFINEQGAQFGYQLIEDPRAVPFNFFYTSNVSVPRRILLELEGFREDFPAAAWEDIEFAYRAAAIGLGIRYQPRARALHHHCVHPRTFCSRQRTSGNSAAIFAGIHPQLEGFLGVNRALRRNPLRRVQRLFLGLLVELGERVDGVIPPRIYRDFLEACYLDGLAEGLHSR